VLVLRVIQLVKKLVAVSSVYTGGDLSIADRKYWMLLFGSVVRDEVLTIVMLGEIYKKQ
jgi:hypothetical protein